MKRTATHCGWWKSSLSGLSTTSKETKEKATNKYVQSHSDAGMKRLSIQQKKVRRQRKLLLASFFYPKHTRNRYGDSMSYEVI